MKRAVFLDRDGVLIEDTGYVSDAADVRMIPGSAEAVRRINDAGLLAIVVTNQSGIARGLFKADDFEAVEERLSRELELAGAHLDAVYMCPHHPEHDRACDCRKPGIALFLRAADEHEIDIASSFFVGDRWRDVSMTIQLGGVPLLVATGAGGYDAPPQVNRVRDLMEAVDRILKQVEDHE